MHIFKDPTRVHLKQRLKGSAYMDKWKGLQKNGMQKEVVEIFLATKMIQEGKMISFDMEQSFHALLRDKGSYLEISLGDEVRIVLLRQTFVFPKKGKSTEFLDFRKPEFLSKHFSR